MNFGKKYRKFPDNYMVLDEISIECFGLAGVWVGKTANF
jgi:hypothetical protein